MIDLQGDEALAINLTANSHLTLERIGPRGGASPLGAGSTKSIERPNTVCNGGPPTVLASRRRQRHRRSIRLQRRPAGYRAPRTAWKQLRGREGTSAGWYGPTSWWRRPRRCFPALQGTYTASPVWSDQDTRMVSQRYCFRTIAIRRSCKSAPTARGSSGHFPPDRRIHASSVQPLIRSRRRDQINK